MLDYSLCQWMQKSAAGWFQASILPFPISELPKLKLHSFNQFTVIVVIVMCFKLGACVASSSPLKDILKQKWEFFNLPKIFSLTYKLHIDYIYITYTLHTATYKLLSVLKSHFDSACMTVSKQLLSKSEKRFVGTHWLQEGLGLSEVLCVRPVLFVGNWVWVLIPKI